MGQDINKEVKCKKERRRGGMVKRTRDNIYTVVKKIRIITVESENEM